MRRMRLKERRTERKWRLKRERFQEDVNRMLVPVLLIAAYIIWSNLRFGVMCPFRLLFSAECPACGLTRAGLSLLRLDIRRAWAYHPAIFVWVSYLFYILWVRYVEILPAAERKERNSLCGQKDSKEQKENKSEKSQKAKQYNMPDKNRSRRMEFATVLTGLITILIYLLRKL